MVVLTLTDTRTGTRNDSLKLPDETGITRPTRGSGFSFFSTGDVPRPGSRRFFNHLTLPRPPRTRYSHRKNQVTRAPRTCGGLFLSRKPGRQPGLVPSESGS